jgi:hypothetical protein
MSENCQETEVWKEGSLCWVEIPASDVEACKVRYNNNLILSSQAEPI